MMRAILTTALLLVTSAASAAPPPPPPEYVWKAAKILAGVDGLDAAKVAPLFADDVAVFDGADPLVKGKPAWLHWRAAGMAHYNGRVIGLSESWGVHGPTDGGELLVVDTYDTVDRTNLPPTFIADPRMAVRSTLYQFGKDGLIHAVRIERTSGFWQSPPSPDPPPQK